MKIDFRPMIVSSALQQGQYVRPMDRGETKANYDSFQANLQDGVYKVVKNNRKSVRLLNITTNEPITVLHDKWRGSGECRYHIFTNQQIEYLNGISTSNS